jgi:hypothetical protein
MSVINNNPGLNLATLLPESIYNDSENFVLFLKAYYEWLQTSTFYLEDQVGVFSAGEIITGDTSGAKAKVKLVGDGYIIVIITSAKNFDTREVISGTSLSTAILSSIRDNVLRRSSNFIDYRSLVTSVDVFAEYLKDELYPNFPSSLYGDNRLVVRKLKDYYQAKGQEQSYKFLFKTLYNQDIDIIFPSEDILRVSAGHWVQSKLLRAVITENIFDFLFKTVRGLTSGAVANVIDIKLVYVGTQQVAEMSLSLVSGTFAVNETIVDVENEDVSTTLYGMITGFNINQSGTGYQVGDQLTITGNGQAASAAVSSIFESPIDSINVVSTGYGYRLNTYAVVNNTGTGGTGLKIKVTGITNPYTVTSGPNTYTVGEVSEVTIVNRGDNYFSSPTITLRDTTIQSIGLLSDKLINITNAGNNYTVGDWLTFSANTGSGANAIVASVNEAVSYDFLFEDNNRLQSETDFDILKQQDWSPVGPIERIFMTNYGSGYNQTSLPTVTVNTSTGSNAALSVIGVQGTGANVEVDSINNVGGIGSIRSITIQDFGVNYTTANVDCTAIGNGNANITPILSGIAINNGAFATDDGKLDYKKIQDSYYYQDFSYVIRSGIEISRYKETLKTLIHPAGLEVFGEISIVSQLNLQMASSSALNIESIGNFIKYIVSQLSVIAKSTKNHYELDLPAQKVQTIATYEASPRVIFAPKGDSAVDAKIDAFNIGNILELSPLVDNAVDLVPQDVFNYWGNQSMLPYSSNTINSLSSISFNSLFGTFTGYNAVETQLKVAGTVDVYTNNAILGTGTSFSLDFAIGDSLIVGNDKFVVNGVSSNTILSIAVSPQSPYLSQSAYKIVV